MEQKVVGLLCLNKGLISSSKQKIITIESWFGDLWVPKIWYEYPSS